MKKEKIIRYSLIVIIVILVIIFGIMPFFNNGSEFKTSIKPWAKDKINSQKNIYDVVVYGQEPDGIAAAVSSAKSGAKTLLISSAENLGGSICDTFSTDLEPSFGPDGELLNKGIYSDFYKQLSNTFTVEKYLKIISDLTQKQKNLEICYNFTIKKVNLENRNITSIELTQKGGQTKTISGRVFIDGSKNGDLLVKAGVPYIKGSADVGMDNTFEPLEYNFEISSPNYVEYLNFQEKYRSDFSKLLSEYRPKYPNISIQGLNFQESSNNKVLVKGIEIYNVNPDNAKDVANAAAKLKGEAEHLVEYLKTFAKKFKDTTISKYPKAPAINEYRHFKGLQTLQVSDILENTFYSNSVLLSSRPVRAGKFLNNKSVIIGTPTVYSIPLGCYVAQNVENLMMTGSKASYSSIASSSASNFATDIASGESAGIISVYSLTSKTSLKELSLTKDANVLKEMNTLLKDQGVYLPEKKYEAKFMSNWSYPALRELNNLGLLAGGSANDFKYDQKAVQSDLVYLLVNGIYRVSKDKYSLDMENRISKFATDKELTKEKLGEILLGLYGKGYTGDPYKAAVNQGYINNFAQVYIKDKSILKLEDIYYIADYNIKKFTGKSIID